MKVCEQRNLVSAHESDMVKAFENGDNDLAEFINLLGESFFPELESRLDREMWALDIAKRLSPNGRRVLYLLSNYAIAEKVGEKREELGHYGAGIYDCSDGNPEYNQV